MIEHHPVDYVVGPVEDIDSSNAVHVAYRGKGRWSVYCCGEVINEHLDEVYEKMPSERTEEFLKEIRFTKEKAFKIADKFREKMKAK